MSIILVDYRFIQPIYMHMARMFDPVEMAIKYNQMIMYYNYDSDILFSKIYINNIKTISLRL